MLNFSALYRLSSISVLHHDIMPAQGHHTIGPLRTSSGLELEVGKRGEVQCLLMCDSSTDASGLTLEKHQVYAVSRYTKRYSEFHTIDLDEGVFDGYARREQHLPTYPVTVLRKDEAWGVCVISKNKRDESDHCKEKVLQWIRRNLGVAALVSPLGARPPSPALVEHYNKKRGCVFAHTVSHKCVHASVLNAIYIS